MLFVISPAKTLDFQTKPATDLFSIPNRLDASAKLVDVLKTASPEKLQQLMGISNELASLNHKRFNEWNKTMLPEESKQAILAFKGDVYQGLQAEDFDEEELSFAQKHLRILSGLYGLLKPLDLIRPYRLEMGTKLAVNGYKDLYAFWGSQLTEEVNQLAGENHLPVLINLASQEYFKALNPKLLKTSIVTPVFKDFSNGKYKVISFYAKKARGMMCRFAIKNKLSSPEELKNFSAEGYAFDPKASTTNEWVFTRG